MINFNNNEEYTFVEDTLKDKLGVMFDLSNFINNPTAIIHSPDYAMKLENNTKIRDVHSYFEIVWNFCDAPLDAHFSVIFCSKKEYVPTFAIIRCFDDYRMYLLSDNLVGLAKGELLSKTMWWLLGDTADDEEYSKFLDKLSENVKARKEELMNSIKTSKPVFEGMCNQFYLGQDLGLEKRVRDTHLSTMNVSYI